MSECKYGDPTCPCQDGDMCHYKAGWKTPAIPVPAEYVDAVLAKKDAEIKQQHGALKEVLDHCAERENYWNTAAYEKRQAGKDDNYQYGRAAEATAIADFFRGRFIAHKSTN